MVAPGFVLIIAFVGFTLATSAALMLQFMRMPPRATFPVLVAGLIAGTVMVGVYVVQSETDPTRDYSPIVFP